MKLLTSFRTRTLVTLTGGILIVYLAIISLVILQTRKNTYNDAVRLVDKTVEKSAQEIVSELNIHVGYTRAFASTFLGHDLLDTAQKWMYYETIMKHMIERSPQYLTLWSTHELSTFQKNCNNSGSLVYEIFKIIFFSIKCE